LRFKFVRIGHHLQCEHTILQFADSFILMLHAFANKQVKRYGFLVNRPRVGLFAQLSPLALRANVLVLEYRTHLPNASLHLSSTVAYAARAVDSKLGVLDGAHGLQTPSCLKGSEQQAPPVVIAPQAHTCGCFGNISMSFISSTSAQGAHKVTPPIPMIGNNPLLEMTTSQREQRITGAVIVHTAKNV
jgi:hypothetical protein